MRSLLSLFLAAGSAGLNPELVVDLTPSTSARPALMQGNLLAAAPVHDETDNWLLGRWTARTPGVEAAAEFMADGTFDKLPPPSRPRKATLAATSRRARF
ncbi:MAG: hypothetical protein U1G07_11505 [Verrucomicrobiota bacterium]